MLKGQVRSAVFLSLPKYFSGEDGSVPLEKLAHMFTTEG